MNSSSCLWLSIEPFLLCIKMSFPFRFIDQALLTERICLTSPRGSIELSLIAAEDSCVAISYTAH